MANDAAQRIDLGYEPRSQFVALHRRKQRWAVVVAHRRAGKTVACVADLIDAAGRCKLPNPRFAYVAPYFSQAKDVAWNYLRQYTAPIPGVGVNESELRVDLPNGGRIRLYGADNYERMRGLYFDGVVLDEYGDMDPRAWEEVLRPSLADRHGWAVFIGTPKGMNHFSKQWGRAQQDSEWLAIEMPASQTGLLDPAELADARKEMSDEQYAAEFECNFKASVVGSYWGKQMAQAQIEGRITAWRISPRSRSIRGGTWAWTMPPRSGARRTWAERCMSSTTTKTAAAVDCQRPAFGCRASHTCMASTTRRSTSRTASGAPASRALKRPSTSACGL